MFEIAKGYLNKALEKADDIKDSLAPHAKAVAAKVAEGLKDAGEKIENYVTEDKPDDKP